MRPPGPRTRLETLTILFSAIGADEGLAVTLSDLDGAVRPVQGTLARPLQKNPRALTDELRCSPRRSALPRPHQPAPGGRLRAGIERAALLLGEGGDHRRALSYEDLGDDSRRSLGRPRNDLERIRRRAEREERRNQGGAPPSMPCEVSCRPAASGRPPLAAAESSAAPEAATPDLAARIESALPRQAVTLRPRRSWFRVAGLRHPRPRSGHRGALRDRRSARPAE
jgi:hypothetical protein